MDLFKDILPAIQQTKEDILVEEADVKAYNPFMVNRALSLHNDCLFFANEMNKLHHLDKRTQFIYHLAAIRSRKRPFVPWAKKAKEEDVELVKWYYQISERKAIDALKILPEAEIEHLRQLKKEISK